MKAPALHRSSFATRLMGAVAVICVATLAPVSALVFTGSSAVPAAGASPSRCATSGIVVWLDTQGNGTAGSTYYNLEFTNLSGHACTLFGYPGVSGVNLGGRQLGKSASRNHVASPQTVTLLSGATATAVVQVVDVNNFSRSTCSQVTAAGLRVYPPNQLRSEVVPFPFGACSLVGPVYLTVQAVRATQAAPITTACQPSQLDIVVSGSQGAAGTIEMTFSLTNTSSVTCTMHGYPGMQLLNASGGAMATTVIRGGGLTFENVAVTDVSLAPGNTAYYNLGFSDVPVGTETACPTADQVESTPPNDTSYAVVPVSGLDACGGGTVHVSPVFASTDSAGTSTTAPHA